MKMVVGGAFQGKTSYAKKIYPDTAWIDGTCCDPEQIYSCGGIYHFNYFIRRVLAQESVEKLWNYIDKLQEMNPEIIIITDETGCGLVPVDAFERTYREQTGRVCTVLAGCSDRVDRVICGIGTVIKGGAG